MKKQLRIVCLSAAFCLVTVGFADVARAVILYGYGGVTHTLYTIDTDTVTVTLIGSSFVPSFVAETELSPDGVIYGAETDTSLGINDKMYHIDPASGGVTGETPLQMLGENDVFTALEFVGSTYYGGLAIPRADGGGDSARIATINLATGGVNLIGDTGLQSTITGLAYDVANSEMFAVTGGGGANFTADLLTIDLADGSATLVAPITLGGADFGGVTALEFGTDGILYALAPNFSSAIAGHLLKIDPLTGEATDLGDLFPDLEPGEIDLNSLTSRAIPEPSTIVMWSLFGLIGGLIAWRRRRKSA